jgi:hypothetical protein
MFFIFLRTAPSLLLEFVNNIENGIRQSRGDIHGGDGRNNNEKVDGGGRLDAQPNVLMDHGLSRARVEDETLIDHVQLSEDKIEKG